MHPAVLEPGLDRHEWETEWQALEPLIEDSPREALPELDDLVARMLAARGYPVDGDDVALAGDDPEVLADFRTAREITRLAESGADISPGDVAPAIEGYRNVYERLIEQRSAP
jgi:hypothetical protein